MWIRSQDKEVLGKFDMLYIDENMSDEIVITGCDGHVHVNDKVLSACELGTYKSKERALEVLDEIQTWIERYEAAKVSGSLFIAFITYEMPKE